MTVIILFFRTILIYFVVFTIMRLLGKREIGKLSVVDLVVFIMIAEIAVFVIEDSVKPLSEGLVPLFTLALLQVGLSFAALRSRKVRIWFEGRPSYIVKHGKLDRAEMLRQRYSLDDLMVQLREHKITNLGDVEFAILETSGRLTVVEKKEKKEGAPDPFMRSRLGGLALPLIMDGKVLDKNLEKIEKNRFWLIARIREKGFHEFKDVFFCSIDDRGGLHVDRKE